MMSEIFRVVHNVSDNTVKQVKLTAKEIEKRDEENQQALALIEEEQQKKQDALAKLQQIGLTLEDITALGLA